MIQPTYKLGWILDSQIDSLATCATCAVFNPVGMIDLYKFIKRWVGAMLAQATIE